MRKSPINRGFQLIDLSAWHAIMDSMKEHHTSNMPNLIFRETNIKFKTQLLHKDYFLIQEAVKYKIDEKKAEAGFLQFLEGRNGHMNGEFFAILEHSKLNSKLNFLGVVGQIHIYNSIDSLSYYVSISLIDNEDIFNETIEYYKKHINEPKKKAKRTAAEEKLEHNTFGYLDLFLENIEVHMERKQLNKEIPEQGSAAAASFKV